MWFLGVSMKTLFIMFFLILTLHIKGYYYYGINGEKIQIISQDNYLVVEQTLNNNNIITEILNNHNYNIISIKEYKNIFIIQLDKEYNKTLISVLENNNVKIYKTMKMNNWPAIITNRIYVETNTNEIESILKQYQLKIIQEMPSVNGFILETENDALQIANKMIEENSVKIAQPDFLIPHIKKFTPNDTYFSSQWHLNNTGELRGSKAGADVNAIYAWDIEKGNSDIIISIVDDGMDIEHPDLSEKVLHSFDFADKDDDVLNTTEEGDDSSIHGTACAGVAAAKGNNGKGVTGICQNCSLVSAKIFSSTGYGYATADADAIIWSAGGEVEYTESIPSVDVISCSWGFDGFMQIPISLNSAINFATQSGRNGKGCVVVFASGNENREYKENELEAHPNIITVGASTDRDIRSNYSNYGPKLDVLAPSNGGYNGIWTTDYRGNIGYNNNGFGTMYPGHNYEEVDTDGNYTRMFGGTSSACPLVSGIAGLILSKNKNLTFEEVRLIIRESADQIGDVDYWEGTNYQYGYGRVNSYKALKLVIANESNDLGEDCNSLGDCSFTCLTKSIGWPNGFCTRECSAGYCPDDFVCKNIEFDNNPYCLKKCTDKNDCKAGYACSSYKDDETTDKYCLSGCSKTGCDGYLKVCDLVSELCVDDIENPCYNVNCGDNSTCNQTMGECQCDTNYILNENNQCVENLCIILDVTCSGNATCDEIMGLCICNEGYSRNSNDECVNDKNASSCNFSTNNNLFAEIGLILLTLFLVLLQRKRN